MALGFFRRNQKAVMIIMVLLMVSFLISIQGFQYLTHFFQPEQVAGTSSLGDLKMAQFRQAESDLQILDSTELATYEVRRYLGYPQVLSGTEYYVLTRDKENRPTAFALLLAEAQKMGIKISAQELERVKEEMGLGEKDVAETLARIKQRLNGTITIKHIDSALTDWLTIWKAAQMGVVDVPASELECRRTFRDLAEKIDLRVVRLKAKDLAAQVTTAPSDEEITRQFNEYNKKLPGRYNSLLDYPFGYLQPNRVKLDCLYFSQQVLDRVCQPGEDELIQYYNSHKNDTVFAPLGKEPESSTELASAPASMAATGTASTPASAPATSTAPATASAPTEPEEGPEHQVLLGSMSFSQARPIVIKLMTPGVTESRMNALDNKIGEFLKANTGSTFETAVASFTKPGTQQAQDFLKKPLMKPIQAMRLDKAMDALAEQAGLTMICYPWGKQGKQDLSPAVLVSVPFKDGQAPTLGDALKRISGDISEVPVDQWAMCQEFPGVLFALPKDPSKYPNMYPLSAWSTALIDDKTVQDDPVLGHSYTGEDGRGTPLLFMAFTSEPFGKLGRGQIQMKIGDISPSKMYVQNSKNKLMGRLTWKLVDARPPALRPESDLQDKDFRDQVAQDVKTLKAMDIADALANKLAKAADKQGLEQAAKDAKLESFDTGLFSRAQLQRNWPANRVPPAMTEAKLDLNNDPPLVRDYISDKAFSLLPASIEPTSQGYGNSQALVVRIAPKNEVLVIQRVGYEPPVQSKYEESKLFLLGQLRSGLASQSLERWFTFKVISDRLDYKPSH